MTQDTRLEIQDFHSQGPTSQSEDSSDEDQALAWSDDNGTVPNFSLFAGLFRSDLFKTLLHKAKATANLGPETNPTELFLEPMDSNQMLFVLR